MAFMPPGYAARKRTKTAYIGASPDQKKAYDQALAWGPVKTVLRSIPTAITSGGNSLKTFIKVAQLQTDQTISDERLINGRVPRAIIQAKRALDFASKLNLENPKDLANLPTVIRTAYDFSTGNARKPGHQYPFDLVRPAAKGAIRLPGGSGTDLTTGCGGSRSRNLFRATSRRRQVVSN